MATIYVNGKQAQETIAKLNEVSSVLDEASKNCCRQVLLCQFQRLKRREEKMIEAEKELGQIFCDYEPKVSRRMCMILNKDIRNHVINF